METTRGTADAEGTSRVKKTISLLLESIALNPLTGIMALNHNLHSYKSTPSRALGLIRSSFTFRRKIPSPVRYTYISR